MCNCYSVKSVLSIHKPVSCVMIFIQADEEDEGSSGLHYCPLKSGSGAEKIASKTTLLSSHLLSNGAVEEITEGTVYMLLDMFDGFSGC